MGPLSFSTVFSSQTGGLATHCVVWTWAYLLPQPPASEIYVCAWLKKANVKTKNRFVGACVGEDGTCAVL